jgi:hypothetical protein
MTRGQISLSQPDRNRFGLVFFKIRAHGDTRAAVDVVYRFLNSCRFIKYESHSA